MADNKGKTKGAMLSAVQSAQMAVGSALNDEPIPAANGCALNILFSF